MWWRFGRVSEYARQEDDPASGIKITWTGPSLAFEDFLDPEHLPDELVSKILKIYSSCMAKFSSYEEARRILVIDPLEDLRYKDNEFWSLLFKTLPPPDAISEIWSGFYDPVTDTDTDSDWTFECLYGISTSATLAQVTQAGKPPPRSQLRSSWVPSREVLQKDRRESFSSCSLIILKLYASRATNWHIRPVWSYTQPATHHQPPPLADHHGQGCTAPWL